MIIRWISDVPSKMVKIFEVYVLACRLGFRRPFWCLARFPGRAGRPRNVCGGASPASGIKKQHRDESAALRAALEQAHGEDLEPRRELARLGWNLQSSTAS